MEYIDKVLQITSTDNRVILGKLKSIDYRGDIYLTHCVEVFDKNGDYYSPFEIYENNDNFTLSLESDSYSYQMVGSMLIKKKDVKSIRTKKQD